MNTTCQKLKRLISNPHSTPLQYHQKDLPVIVQVDASKLVLGTCLVQNGKTVASALKLLTDGTTWCTNTGRKLLVVSCKIEIDYKLLEGKNLTATAPHLQWMLLHLQKYSDTIRYRPGSELQLKDVMPILCRIWQREEISLNLHVDHTAFSNTRLAKVHKETDSCPVLSTVYRLTHNGWPATCKQPPESPKNTVT